MRSFRNAVNEGSGESRRPGGGWGQSPFRQAQPSAWASSYWVVGVARIVIGRQKSISATVGLVPAER